MAHDPQREQARAIYAKLKMAPIPVEGGYYALKFRSGETIESPPEYGGGPRAVVSTIYYLLYGTFNTMHRMRNNEIWCYHGGGTLKLHELRPEGTLITHKLGDVLKSGENQSQVAIKAFSWMAAELEDRNDYVLVTCCVAPGFDPADMTFPDRAEMSAQYPQHKDLFTRLIRVKPGSTQTDTGFESPPL